MSNAASSSKRSVLYQPPVKSTHQDSAGIAGRLPVLTAQAAFRSNVAHSGIADVATHTASPASFISTQQLMSPLSFGKPASGNDSSLLMRAPLHATSGPRASSPTLLLPVKSVARHVGAASPLHVHPLVAAVDSSKSLQRLSDEISTFLDHEIGILASQNDGSADDAGPQRLAVFKAAFRMLLPAVPQLLQPHLEAVMSEYDRFLQSVEVVAIDQTRLRERQRLETHYAQHYTEEARMKEAEVARRRDEFHAVEANMKTKLSNLEKQLAAMQLENRILKGQQNEETERYSAMAQSVIESRLAANKAELALIEMKEIYERVRGMEKNMEEIMQDYGKMLKLVRYNKLTFEPKSTWMLDCLMREGVL